MNDELPPWVTEGPPDEPSHDPAPPRTDADALYRYTATFYVGRWDSKNGHAKKRFSPFCWDGREWQAKQLIPKGQRPLFWAPPDDPSNSNRILVVEGEKAALSAPQGFQVVTWSGGGNAVDATDWSPLRGREVLIWPDNDEPGYSAAAEIRAILPQARMVPVPADFPEGWDLADPPPPGWDTAAIMGLLETPARARATPKDPSANTKPARGIPCGPFMVLTDEDADKAPVREYYLKGLISPAEMSAIYGEPGCGKSFLAVYIARAIAQGRQIFGKRIKATKVLFLALEGVAGFENRLRAQIITNGKAGDFFYIAQPINLFSGQKAKYGVIEVINKFEIGLTVIDTLNRAMGEGSENDPADMGAFIQNIDAIRAATSCHVMLIHHSGKDSARGMRGHSALLGACDVVIEVSKSDSGRTRIATVRKAKDDVDGGEYGFQLSVLEMGTDADGDPITTCIVEEVETSSQKTEKANALTMDERHWFREMAELFAREGTTQTVRPERGIKVPIPCATRDVVREWFKTRGLVGVAHSVAKPGVLTSTDRSKFGRMINVLKRKEKIGVHGDWIWIVS